jgi:hypothetical protein
MKKNNCRKNADISYREIQIKRLELMQSFVTEEPETWHPLDANPDYLVSNHGRLMNLKSYRGRSKILCPSIKMEKYLYYTISSEGIRKGICIKKCKGVASNQKPDNPVK